MNKGKTFEMKYHLFYRALVQKRPVMLKKMRWNMVKMRRDMVLIKTKMRATTLHQIWLKKKWREIFYKKEAAFTTKWGEVDVLQNLSLSLYLSVYIFIHVCKNEYINIHVRMHNMCVYIDIYVYIYISIYIYIYIYICIHQKAPLN